MSGELNNIKVSIRPFHFSGGDGKVELRIFRVQVVYNGRDYVHERYLNPSDNESVLDLCFTMAKQHIKKMINEDTKKEGKELCEQQG